MQYLQHSVDKKPTLLKVLGSWLLLSTIETLREEMKVHISQLPNEGMMEKPKAFYSGI